MKTNHGLAPIKLQIPHLASGADISPDFRYSATDDAIASQIVRHWETAEAIRKFDALNKGLSSYCYWYLLGTLWVSYSGWSELATWKRLFASPRKNRETSLMKPSELRVFCKLPGVVTAYRAHRSGEQEWIAYTLDPHKAAMFAIQRGVEEIYEYEIDREDVLALFLRRGETEILVLDRTRVRFVGVVAIVMANAGDAVSDREIQAASRMPEATGAVRDEPSGTST